MSQSLDRGLRILAELAQGERSLEDVARLLEVHKSTALRLLRTLEEQRFVQHDAAHRYRLGTRFFALAQRALEERDVRQVAAPHLRELNQRLGHTLHLATYEAGEVVYVDKYDSRHPVRMYSRIGHRAPLHCTAVAKILISAMPEAEQRTIAREIEYTPFTPNTITTPEAYLEELDRVRRLGYAVDHGEHEDFVNCIAMPVRDVAGRTLAAVSMTVPRFVLEYDEVLKLLPELQATVDAISAEYGWDPTTKENNAQVRDSH